MPVRGIGSVICPRGQLPREHRAVLGHYRLALAPDSVPGPGRHYGLLAAYFQSHWPSSDLHRQIGVQRLVQYVLLVAEASANVRLDDPHLSHGQSERDRDALPNYMRDLRRCDHRNLSVCIHICP